MFGRKRSEPLLPWAVGAGAAVGVSAAALAVIRLVRNRRVRAVSGVLDRLEDAAVDVLRRDRVTGACAIDVAALGPGIVELTGMVPNHEAGQRAARLLHALPGVRTVVNRLEVGAFEERLAENRERPAAGEPSLWDSRRYGVRVGTGRRRQGDTEPPRPDDSLDRRMRELEVHPAELQDAASSETVTGDNSTLPH
jgi:hypothetical protein